MIICLIMSISVSMLFFVSGISKMFVFEKSILSILKLEIIPQKYAKIISYGTPFFEIGVAVLLLLYTKSILVNLVAITLILVLVFINCKAIISGKQSDCYCLGSMINTKVGYGGLVQCLLLLLSLLPNVINESKGLRMLSDIQPLTLFFLFCTSFLWMVTLIIIRKIIEVFYFNTSELKS